ncbi:MAG: hypothetical protein BGO49_22585 [Planctomycetales bacterium 71-10]|nr:MAG: hypothetical protein BGO49_22585 [Planctomycetales bacterium 71-10]
MFVSIVDTYCYVYRQPGDPVLRPNRSRISWSPPGWYAAESRFLHNVRKILDRRSYDLIKKRMWRDGHLFGSEHLQYLRSRKLRVVPSLYVYHADAALEVAAENYNVLGRATFDVVYGAGREHAPEFERACREWVRRRESASPCYEVSWVGEATIDGHAAVRRLYRGFTDLDAAMAFVEDDPVDARRLIDRRTVEAALLHGAC